MDWFVFTFVTDDWTVARFESDNCEWRWDTTPKKICFWKASLINPQFSVCPTKELLFTVIIVGSRLEILGSSGGVLECEGCSPFENSVCCWGWGKTFFDIVILLGWTLVEWVVTGRWLLLLGKLLEVVPSRVRFITGILEAKDEVDVSS